MAQIVETNRTTQSTLGRGSEEVQQYVEGSSTTTKPEQVITKSNAVHVGIAFEFTLVWQGRAKS